MTIAKFSLTLMTDPTIPCGPVTPMFVPHPLPETAVDGEIIGRQGDRVVDHFGLHQQPFSDRVHTDGVAEQPFVRVRSFKVLYQLLAKPEVLLNEGFIGLLQLEVILDRVVFFIEPAGNFRADIQKDGFMEFVVPEEK